MTIAYIAHPISGDVEANLRSIREIVREVNDKHPNIVPFVPYYCDVLVMHDHVPELRARGIKNGIAIINRKGAIDELWVYKAITSGVKDEIIAALNNGIPVIAKTILIENDLKEIKKNHHRYGGEKWV